MRADISRLRPRTMMPHRAMTGYDMEEYVAWLRQKYGGRVAYVNVLPWRSVGLYYERVDAVPPD